MEEKVFATYKEAYMYHLDNEDVILGEPNPNNKLNKVLTCDICGKLTWGSHTSKHCQSPDCVKKVKRDRRKKYNDKCRAAKQAEYKPPTLGGWLTWDDTNMDDTIKQILTESEAKRERSEAVAEWNAAHCCPFFEGSKDSLKCFYCKRGINYAGASTLSNRRCPENPIATDGSRYIQRAAYGKNSHSTHGIKPGKRYDVFDNMPQHLKVQLVERMQRLGREVYLWSNGHVDITPEPDSNN